ncbi:MAG: hypothetical protein H6586_00255 [Flavobacteriales bacterium]|nr:hypothetical protein [Flavobacteriales bacterium]
MSNTDTTTQLETKSISDLTLLLLTLALAVIYFIFSRFSNGFYMHDEVANFIGMQAFWGDPASILGANSKTGYKLFFVLPALGGYAVLQFFNSLLAAFTVYFSYKILQLLKSKYSLLIFFLLGIQPLWFMLSFRSYAEILIAFLLVLAAYQHFKKNFIWAALIISYVAFTRQEYHVLSGLYFLYLIFNKKWLPALLTGTFTVVNFLMGFVLTGDILSVPKDIMEYSKTIKDAWPKQGFDHYFLMSSVIFGSVGVVLYINYIASSIIYKIKPIWILLIPTVVIFLLNCAFNAQFMDFGPGNAGNLRYLLTMSPFLGILGVFSFDSMEGKKKWKLLYFIIPLLILIGIYQAYDHNFIKLDEENRKWTSFSYALVTSILILLPLTTKKYFYFVMGVCIGLLTVSIDTRQIQPEEETVKKAAKWFNSQIQLSKNPQPGKRVLITEDTRISTEHALFYFYSGKSKSDFKNKPVTLTKEATDTLKVGDLVIWESHYGYRPKLRPTSQPYDYYEKDARFEKIQYYQSKDRRFTIVFFLKVKE